jgi:hypothetical protein
LGAPGWRMGDARKTVRGRCVRNRIHGELGRDEMDAVGTSLLNFLSG